jgi:ammonia channel protein AmtB
MCALVLGKRVGYGREEMAPHNLVLTLAGAAMLCVGWFGFNTGSALAADGGAGFAMLTTQVATACAALAWIFAEWDTKGKLSALGIASGAVAGLVVVRSISAVQNKSSYLGAATPTSGTAPPPRTTAATTRSENRSSACLTWRSLRIAEPVDYRNKCAADGRDAGK